ncbi:HAMP domain-containing sensor histidine kinase [Aurantimonas sp. Leaf443]|uniref:sensor histidine kinase n=1 Tax=Aurantimonas sp. Leaf443 TaxID=1736378 RepID=UPI0006FB8E8D|nr:HAMP domain-containing sensor histidine kinase [Aurantimonas sp. Leaf443]KQT88218.1 hypothetical protein ASG48_01930 [Aurantimonas sp. Leaf443]
MDEFDGAKGRDDAKARRQDARPAARLDALVSAGIDDEGERRLQGRVLAGLLAAALGAALLSPLLLMLGHGVAPIAAPLIVAALLLCAAAGLSLTGALEAAALTAGLVVTAGLGWAASATGGLSSPLLLLLAAMPLEAVVAGRRRLALQLAAGAALVPAALALLPGLGSAPDLSPMPFAAGALLLHAATLALRAGARPRIAGGPRRPASETSDRMPAPRLPRVALSGAEEVISASAEAAALIDLRAAAAPGASFTDLVHLNDRVLFLQALRSVLAGGPAREVEARLRRGLGHEPFVLRMVREDDGRNPPCVLVGLHAGTSEGSASLELRAALEVATQSSAAKTQFLAAVSHELRTPLNAIIGFSDILDQEIFGGFETPRQKEYVGLIRQSGRHLLDVVNTLLDVSKIEAGRYELTREDFALETALASAGDTMREAARAKGLRLDIRSCAAGLRLNADQRACHQILLNLLSNAVKFTETGVVTLETRLVGASVEICVSDTGIGISESDIERLGRPFTQLSSGANRRYQGTGLGLSLVKGLAELHGGDMRIRSQPGIGTMVTVTLPLDGSEPSHGKRSVKENVVALNDARSNPPIDSPFQEARRTA